MKTLFIIPSLSRLWGGTTVATLNLFYALQASGVDIELWSARRKEDEITSDLLHNPKIRFFDSLGGWRYSYALKRALELEIKNFDIVHIHGMWLYPHLVAAKIAKKCNTPYIISPHGMVEADALARKRVKKKIYWSLFEKINFQNACAIHAITENEKRQVSTLVPSKPVFVLPNGIHTLPKNPKNNFPDEATVLFIGRLHPIKAIDRLLQTIAMIKNIRLIVAGDGESRYKKTILDMVCTLGLDARVEFVGFADEAKKKELYLRASFLATPSHSEGLSVAALEAISHGLPVLITKSCHFDEIARAGAGVVINDNNPETIKRGIEQILQADLFQMSHNAFELSKEYSLDSVAKKLIAKYSEATGCA